MPPSTDRPLWDRLGRAVLYPYLMLMHRLRWHGVENVPRAGPAILAANHQSFLDPVLVGYAAGRPVVFMGWDYYYRWPVLGRLMRLYQTVPVDLDAPGPSALERMVRALQQGKLCGIFPEAGRTPDGLLTEPKPGAAALALRTGAPLVPVTIHGAFRAWPKGQPLPAPAPISLCFGRPIRPEPTARPDRSERRRLTLELMERIADGFARLGRPDLAAASRRRLDAWAHARR